MPEALKYLFFHFCSTTKKLFRLRRVLRYTNTCWEPSLRSRNQQMNSIILRASRSYVESDISIVNSMGSCWTTRQRFWVAVKSRNSGCRGQRPWDIQVTQEVSIAGEHVTRNGLNLMVTSVWVPRLCFQRVIPLPAKEQNHKSKQTWRMHL